MGGRADDDGCSGRGHRGEIRHHLHPVLPGAQKRDVRDELLRGGGVKAQRIDPHCADVALADEKARRLLR